MKKNIFKYNFCLGCIHLDEIRLWKCPTSCQLRTWIQCSFFFLNANKLKSHGTNCHVLLQGLLIWLETVHPLAYVPLDVMPISHLLKAISDMHLSTFCTNVHYGKSTPLEEEVLHIHPKVPLCDRPSCTYYYHNYWNVIHKFKSTIEWGRSAIERRMKRTSSIEVQIPRKVKGQKGGERGGGGIWIFIC
jgi:hypothetical protein